MNKKPLFKILSILLLLLLNLIPSKADPITETMGNYCTVPPFMEAGNRTNILLVMDFSGSMQDPVYTDDYDKNKMYYGYFEPNRYYKYNSNGYWEVNKNCNIDEGSKYYRIGNSPDCVSGNVLNWIATSRIDVSLKVMIGGKTKDCDGNTCLINRGGERKKTLNISNKEKCSLHTFIKNWGDFTCIGNGSDWYYSEKAYKKCDMMIDIKKENEEVSCPIGDFEDRYLRVKVNKREGVLQKYAGLGNFAFIVFGGDSSPEREGEIRVGLHEYKSKGMDYLVSKIEEEFPYGATPTGQALYEVKDYLMQKNNHSYESNSSYINKNNEEDPFYDRVAGGTIPCKKNVIILISDGMWNVDNKDPINPAYQLNTEDLRDDLKGKQNAITYTLFIFADDNGAKRSMKSTAAAGTFIDLDRDNSPYDINIYDWSYDISFPRPNCNPSGTYNDECKEWDKNRDGEPDGYFFASSGEEFENAFRTIFTAIKKYTYSGGAVAVLGERDKENSATSVVLKGSVLAQSLFFTRKYGVDWVGKVYSYWYNLKDETIREDTDINKILNPTVDKIIEFALKDKEELIINRYNVKKDGSKGELDVELNDPDNVNYLFETGYNLWADFDESNDNTEDDRKIYFAACERGEDCLKEFVFDDVSKFLFEKSYEGNIFKIPLLGFPASCFNMCNYFDQMSSFDFITLWNKFLDCLNNNSDYDKLIKYIRGKDFTGWRNRTAGGKVWKLGDIIHSSPKIVHYEDKNVIIVGANDGMLHVFKLGKTTEKGMGGNNWVKLEGQNIGKELWAFIPLNMMPYLRFLADPVYCHTYYVDSSVFVFDTKDNRKILIGSMRLGGGTGDTTTNNNDKYKPVNPPKWACPTTLWDFMKEQCELCAEGFLGFDFVCSWIPSTPPDFSHCIGLYSYFALDITDINNPKFLWEFSHPDLGFTYSGPAIIQKKVDDEYKYYVMFGSGPTNYYGNSNQTLKYFVIKLDGSNIHSPYIIDTGIRNAFSGRLFKKGFDLNKDGNTDYVFVGYARRDGDMNNWKGGLLSIDVRDRTPYSWNIKEYFTDAQEPITAKVELGKCFGRYYLYFGTGRWFYKFDNPLAGQRGRLYGVHLDCDTQKVVCTPNLNVADNSEDVCKEAQNNTIRSWYVELDLGNKDYNKERDITDPILTNLNVVLFTTIEPSKDPCGFGGRTRVWGLNCATGGAILDKCPVYNIDPRLLKGSDLLQLSGGNIDKINIRELAQEQQTNNSKTSGWLTGTAPEGAPSFVYPAPPKTGAILLWLEK